MVRSSTWPHCDCLNSWMDGKLISPSYIQGYKTVSYISFLFPRLHSLAYKSRSREELHLHWLLSLEWCVSALLTRKQSSWCDESRTDLYDRTNDQCWYMFTHSLMCFLSFSFNSNFVSHRGMAWSDVAWWVDCRYCWWQTKCSIWTHTLGKNEHPLHYPFFQY